VNGRSELDRDESVHLQLPDYILQVNGRSLSVTGSQVDESLVHVLRERLGVTSVKNACGSGDCGACAVLLDGELRLACLTLAVLASGTAITTAAGIRADDPADVAAALAALGAVQCGFCTPGAVIAGHALLARDPDPSEAAIRDGLSGVLCRCGGYGRLVAGVRAAVRARSAQRVAAGEAGGVRSTRPKSGASDDGSAEAR
jgi:carbon-monoxide dehydrogenase small subunit